MTSRILWLEKLGLRQLGENPTRFVLRKIHDGSNPAGVDLTTDDGRRPQNIALGFSNLGRSTPNWSWMSRQVAIKAPDGATGPSWKPLDSGFFNSAIILMCLC